MSKVQTSTNKFKALQLSVASGVICFSVFAHATSSFEDIYNIVFDKNPMAQSKEEKIEMPLYQNGKKPRFVVESSDFFNRQLPKDVNRILTDKSDVLTRDQKLLHPNGVCFSGTWEITQVTSYSGYFKTGAKSLLIARASTTLGDTDRGEKRGFAFAGKIYNSMDPKAVTDTANFFTIDVLAGTKAKRFLDVEMTNQPATGFRLSGIGLALKVASIFSSADSNPGFRPVTQIAALGLGENETIKSPKYIKLQSNSSNKLNNEVDFRDELSETTRVTGLKFNILVNNVDSDPSSSSWFKVGEISLKDSIISYGCDRQLHFPHPKISK